MFIDVLMYLERSDISSYISKQHMSLTSGIAVSALFVFIRKHEGFVEKGLDLQKQPSRGVLRCSENMQEIYKRTPMPKCDLNILDLH